MSARHIGIAGAGLLGRLLAWRLASAGHRVTVFDPADGPQQRGAAGWTAAGMLCPWAELECANLAVADLGVRSLDLWREVVGRLPGNVYFRREGSLLLAPREQPQAAHHLIDRLQTTAPQHAPHALTLHRLLQLEPALTSECKAWLIKGEGQIHTVQAMQALTDDATARGVQWRWCHSVREIEAGCIDGQRYDHVFDVRGVGARPDLPVRGVRGEILWLHAPGVALGRPVRYLHLTQPVYLVPRPGDVIVVGATEIESEDRGPVSVRSMLALLAAAQEAIPALADARLLHSESNLRPTMPDRLPRTVHSPGLTRINGLYRHGWMIAPALMEDALRTAGL